MTQTEIDLYEQAKLDVFQQLLDYGIDPWRISDALGIEASQVRHLQRTTTRLIPEDAKIADAMRVVVKRSIEVALDILEYGPNEQRLQVMKSVLGPAARLIGKESEGTLEEERQAVTRIFQSMRGDVDPEP